MSYISVVPAIRTIPGVEVFDYSIDSGCSIAAGDLIRVPFRGRLVPALVTAASDASPYSEKTISLSAPQILISFGPTLIKLLADTSAHTFTSQPSVLHSWLRSVPKRVKRQILFTETEGQLDLSLTRNQTKFLTDVLRSPEGLIPTAISLNGRTLILSAWKNSADSLGAELDCPVLHSDIPAGKAWNLILDFISGSSPRLVTTKLGSWLACFADAVLVEEPENDDFKQDELSPRFDARWIVEHCSALRNNLSITNFSLTPKLDSKAYQIPDIQADAIFEIFSRAGRSAFDDLTASSLNRMEEALSEGRSVTIINPVRGDRARFACANCGWTATCPSCGYLLGQYGSIGLCRKCGKKSPLPLECKNCSGTDFTRGRPGLDRLKKQISALEKSEAISIINLTQAQEQPFRSGSFVLITDASLLSGAVEDIRRRERLVIAWRRLAAKAFNASATLVTQGKDEVLSLCQRTLSSDGLSEERKIELDERKLFNFPPSSRLIKLLVDGDEQKALDITTRVTEAISKDWIISGPFPVPYRPSSRIPRYIIQVTVPLQTPHADLLAAFDPFKSKAYIDLDPVAFFC